jgi:pSer/pThr/pTyr-binding forkhead associated (FHA) protein
VSRVEIDGELRLGRNPECELLLDDPQASRLHARLRPTPEGVLLTDEGSTNGTRVNGKKVSGSALLRDGDNIAIGGTKLRVVAAL